MQISSRCRKTVISAFALVVISLLISATCFAGEFVSVKIYPEHVGVFTTVMKQQFVAFGVDAQGVTTNITEKVSWESSDKGVVTIDEKGLASVVAKFGQAKITCSYPKVSGAHPGIIKTLLLRTI